MSEWDLTSKICLYLDRHLVFPLFEFLSEQKIYEERELQLGKYDLLKNTKMVDFAIDVFKELYPDEEIPQEMVEKRSEVVVDLTSLNSKIKPIFAMFKEEKVVEEMERSRDPQQFLAFLVQNYEFSHEKLAIVYDFAKIKYESGSYSEAADALMFYLHLVPPSDKKYLSALWGRLASDILLQNWNGSLEDLNRLKDYIDNNSVGTALQTLQQRTWLIHWSLFVFFNHARGRDLIIDMFLFQPQYLNAIQTICPHILRYLTTAVIRNTQRRAVLKELVKVIQQESYAYSDPITEFVKCLYVNFDFDGAQQKLRECAEVLANDFFLVACLNDFMENARLFIFETFCRIHECISIKMLADKLNMTPEEAERWIVDLIRNTPLEAKIDSKRGHVVMGTQAVSPYQLLIDKTKQMTFRSNVLCVNIEKKMKQPVDSLHWGNSDYY